MLINHTDDWYLLEAGLDIHSCTTEIWRYVRINLDRIAQGYVGTMEAYDNPDLSADIQALLSEVHMATGLGGWTFLVTRQGDAALIDVKPPRDFYLRVTLEQKERICSNT